MHDDLVDVFDELRPQLVVHDLAELVAAPMATKRGIPHVTVGYSGALTDALAAALLDGVAPIWEHEGVTPTPAGFNGQLLLHPLPPELDERADGPRHRCVPCRSTAHP